VRGAPVFLKPLPEVASLTASIVTQNAAPPKYPLVLIVMCCRSHKALTGHAPGAVHAVNVNSNEH
jgi:hypothetical protein